MNHAMRSIIWASALVASATLSAAARADEPPPSRPPIDKCVWENLADKTIGLAAWVQRFDFGFRQIHFEFVGNALAIKYSDGSALDPLVELFDITSGETADAAMLCLLREKTDKSVSARCVLTYIGRTVPAGVKRYTFSPDAAYAKELKALANDDVPQPPCGNWGEMPDGIQYFDFEVPADEGRKVLFVRAGQDEPLFDEQTLRVSPAG